ncbi:MAG: hypothetical protein CMM61_16220 [Rhodospirillaceae bacterium]|nr:hypothetical protein [Rhodospirillaceae bacterium]|tara:strand:- start:157 stop:477 length:321 start_codon:yes stop_codon:yes gene_type:complete
MKLPEPIQTFFDADAPDAAAPIGAFAPDAVVQDEGKTHAGHIAIETWWQAAKTQYQYTAEPCDITQSNGLTIVRANVTGNFPSSPALLTYSFLLDDGRIAALKIGA